MKPSDIVDRNVHIGIIGLGYVGLPLVREFVAAGFKVIGFDVDKNKISSLNNGQSYIKHIPSSLIKSWRHKKLFKATHQFSELKKIDVILICVPTPLDIHRQPDLSMVIQTSEQIAAYLRKGQLIILESTTYPGTTVEELQPRFESKGFVVGKDIYLAYSPEREDPGNPKYTTSIIPKVVGADDARSRKLSTTLYQQVVTEVHAVSSTRAAEATKILENIYRCINIAMINELKMIFHEMKINIWEVIEAAATKPFGFQKFTPGPGLGGHCIPIDPFYLSWKAKEFNQPAKFIELAGEVNCSMPDWVIERISEVLSQHELAVKNARILIVGLAYKPNVDDDRESPSLELVRLLKKRGAKVSYHDPHIKKFKGSRAHNFQMSSTALTSANLKKIDAAVIATDHKDVDYQKIVDNCKIVIDTRNATHLVKRKRKHIYLA